MPKLAQIDKNLYYFKVTLVTDEIDRDYERLKLLKRNSGNT
jgi:hypothetical protein